MRRSVRHATAAVALSLGGGERGNLILHCDDVFYPSIDIDIKVDFYMYIYMFMYIYM